MSQTSLTLAPNQRRITLLRHAQAVPDERGDDHARPLSAQGREDALALGSWLRENCTLPDLVLCSTSTRTRETLAALDALLPTLLLKPLYLASAEELMTVLREQDDAARHILLIGHNPGIHGLAALLIDDYVRDTDADQLTVRFPTCGLVSMYVPAPHWNDLRPQSAIADLLRFGAD